MAEVKDLLNQLTGIRKDISGLREQLNQLNDKKEGVFEEKDTFSKKINSIISEIRQFKRERDDFTRKVRTLKEERKQFNDQLKALSEELRVALEKKDQVKGGSDLKGNPVLIKKKIEEMEYKIETEGMTFENEKKTMTKINEMKKQLEGAKDVIEAADTIRIIKNKIRDIRKQANTVHRDVQENAKNSQDRHEKILALSKQIDDLKVSEKDSFDKFMTSKDDFNKVNDALKEKLVLMNQINEELKKHNIKSKEEKIERENKTLEEKSKQVDEKIKGRKKLTTEDLLVFQKTMGDEEEIIEEHKNPKPAVKITDVNKVEADEKKADSE